MHTRRVGHSLDGTALLDVPLMHILLEHGIALTAPMLDTPLTQAHLLRRT
jgi:hypothetical protein